MAAAMGGLGKISDPQNELRNAVHDQRQAQKCWIDLLREPFGGCVRESHGKALLIH